MLCAYLLGEWRVELKACLRHWDAPGKEVGGAGGLHSRLHHTSHRPWSLHRPSFNCEILEDHWRPDSGNRFPSGKTSIHLLCVSETPGEGSESPTLRSTATRKEWRENGRSSAPPSNLQREENSSLLCVINTKEAMFPRPCFHGYWVFPRIRHTHSSFFFCTTKGFIL